MFTGSKCTYVKNPGVGSHRRLLFFSRQPSDHLSIYLFSHLSSACFFDLERRRVRIPLFSDHVCVASSPSSSSFSRCVTVVSVRILILHMYIDGCRRSKRTRLQKKKTTLFFFLFSTQDVLRLECLLASNGREHLHLLHHPSGPREVHSAQERTATLEASEHRHLMHSFDYFIDSHSLLVSVKRSIVVECFILPCML